MLKFLNFFSSKPKGKLIRGSRSYTCRCGSPIFFQNSRCLRCNSELGYEPGMTEVFPIEQVGSGKEWRIAKENQDANIAYWRCANFDTPAVCNWLVSDTGNLDEGLCIACRLNRTIPDLSVPENGELWGVIEFAKRRLVSSLLAWEMPVVSREEDPERGLAFDFLRSPEGGPAVMTGHDNGLITLNIEEARSSTREKIREQMGEPYRTILGHLRHEVGHYYWDRLIQDSDWIEDFRRLFGDERADYSESLKRNYEQGPPPDWPDRFISSYASCHPWEDWAETWAHMLHITDTLTTAMSFGLDPRELDLEVRPFPNDVLFRPTGPDAERFLSFINGWTALTAVMNELSRSMGEREFYPFAMPGPTVTKLSFIYTVVRTERERSQKRAEASSQPALR